LWGGLWFARASNPRRIKLGAGMWWRGFGCSGGSHGSRQTGGIFRKNMGTPKNPTPEGEAKKKGKKKKKPQKTQKNKVLLHKTCIF